MVMPGAVGLAIIDSFASGLPMLTTDISGHGPEIAYLANGQNGLMSENSTTAYADAMCSLLGDSSLESKLRKGCRRSVSAYSLPCMVNQFANGIERCLGQPKR
jgi:glycosyltransferase involved in cell wall biosynthesis